MRLCQRGLVTVRIAPRVSVAGELGSRREAFSDEHITAHAVCLPTASALREEERGLLSGEGARLIMEREVSVRSGDKLFIGDKEYIVRCVQVYSQHRELLCEAIG